MKITRVIRPEFIDTLKPLLLPDLDSPEKNVDHYAAVIQGFMREDPSQVLVLLALDENATGEEISNYVQAFVIALDIPGTEYSLISQAWAQPTVGKLTDVLFQRVILWAQERGKQELRIETARDGAAITRRWGFKVISQTMSFPIGIDFEVKLLEALRQQVQDNGQQWTENSKHVDQRAEGAGNVDGELADSSDRPGSEPVLGNDRPGVGSGLPAEYRDDPEPDRPEQAA